jgi:hypothetical protein
MLNRLLEQLRSPGDLFTLLLYVISACYPKMQLRMKNLAVSVPNRNALKGIPLDTLQFSEQSHEYTKDERANDFLFLSEIFKIENFKMPNLIREADYAKAQGDSYHLDFYTKDTWMEFHRLLCHLLDQFWDGLEDLNNSRGTTDINKIIHLLVGVANIGSALRAMVRSGAIKKHLKFVTIFLPDRPTVKKQGVDDDDEDDELRGVQPYSLHQGQPLPKWKAFNNWLALLITHFDAVQVLAAFILKSPVPIVNFTIKYLSPSRPDRAMLSWKRLLLDHLPGGDSDTPSTQEIIDFLSPKLDENSKGKKWKHPRKAVSTKEMGQIVQSMQDVRNFSGRKDDKDNFTKAVDNLIQDLKRRDCVAPRWETDAKAIITALEYLKQPSFVSDVAQLVTEIAQMVETLNRNTPLYNFVRDDEPEDVVAGFDGRDHCEICLATESCSEVNGIFVSHPFYCWTNLRDAVFETGRWARYRSF